MADEKKQVNLKQLEKVIAMMVDNDLVEVEIVNGDDKIYFRRPEPVQQQQLTTVPMQAPMIAVPAPAAAPAVAPAAKDDNLLEITSPIVGTFYTAPSPDSDPYIKVGDSVNADTVVCIVEAMKVMNEIKAEINGTIAEACVQDGQAIEYGQVLFKVNP